MVEKLVARNNENRNVQSVHKQWGGIRFFCCIPERVGRRVIHVELLFQIELKLILAVRLLINYFYLIEQVV